jgi:hypothetical protein
VLGKWIGEHPVYYEDEHKKTIRAVQTVEMRGALDDVDVEVLGTKTDGGAYISLVTDVTTGKTDGTITPGGLIVITGDKIKIDPIDEGGLGIFIESLVGGTAYLPGPYAHNTSKEIIALVPPLADGPYTLYVVTRSTGSRLLNDPRKIVYTLALYVGVRP